MLVYLPLLYDKYNNKQTKLALKNQLLLRIPTSIQQQAWKDAQQHSHKLAQYSAYLNRVCLYTFLDWLNNQLSDEALSNFSIYPSEDGLGSILEVVNGTAIEIGTRRIILIPNENIGSGSLRVPQEWIDIPTFVGDYYLAVQLYLEANADECTLTIQGFATHRQVKQLSKYDPRDRTYILSTDQLITSLTVMQLTLGMQMREEVPELPTLSEPDAQSLLEMLGDASIYSPRLRVNIPFAQWAALLNNDEWRQQLYLRRTGRFVTKSKVKTNNLSKWLQNTFDDGWQSLNTLFNQESGNLIYSFRNNEVAAKGISVDGIKLIDLGMQLSNQSVALLVGLTPGSDGKVAVRVQLHPAKGQTYLPPNIKLALIYQSESILQEIKSRIQDNFIQLKRFICPPGKTFKIQVSIDEFKVTEEFVIEPFKLTQQ
ncbi:DUF1822 family protein [Nostoc sp. C052]|uniref:DUF1822 family protein n=1 Tax=Nostoc sp. C052 TaxID=2576902 RepID=UPI0015C3ABB4|nr:DUF1822 family protein [Nostoc sp. C052]QLE39993.1 DUF1822 family protein [Nostoc sp. C052]